MRARRGSQEERQRALRLSNSIRVPWAVGLFTLLVLAVAIGGFVGKTGDDPLEVPRAVLDAQQFQAVATAQSVRKSMNEGVADLDGLAAAVSALSPKGEGGELRPLREVARSGGEGLDTTDLARALQGFSAAHGRYTAIGFMDSNGRPVADARRSTPLALPPGTSLAKRGIEPGAGTATGNAPVIHQFSPVPENRSGIAAVVARYDPAFLRFPLTTAEPGSAWIVDRKARVVAALGDAGQLQPLPRPELLRAAREAIGGQTGARSTGGSLDRQEVLAWAPIAGFGPAGALDWSIVTSRAVSDFAFPEVDARRQALLSGVVLGVLALLIFGWLWIIVVSPVLSTQREAERLAFGDLSKPVDVVRYDEIGLIGRALERMRVLMIRRRAQK